MKKLLLCFLLTCSSLGVFSQTVSTVNFDFTALNGGADGRDITTRNINTGGGIITNFKARIVSNNYNYNPHIIDVIAPDGTVYSLGPTFDSTPLPGPQYDSGAISETQGNWRIGVSEPGSANGTLCRVEFEYTYVDNPPTAICQDITVQLDAVGNASIVASDIDGGSSDAEGPITFSVDQTNFTCANIGANTVTLTVTDTAGQTDTCTATVTVEDNIAPTAVCQDITVQLDASGMASIIPADIDGGSTDNCGVANLSVDTDTFDCSNVGPNTVTLTVTDVNGNSSTCTVTVTVEDNIAPIIACPNDVMTGTDPGICGGTVFFSDAIAVDNCAVASIMQTGGLPSGSVFPVGINTIEFTATDVNGNTQTCTFTITITDDEAPMAVCQDITIQLDTSGNATIVASDVDGGSTDNCGVDTIAIDINSFTCANVGTNNVVLTVTDAEGLSSSCTAVVTVEDDTDPIIACTDITVQLDAMGMATITPADVASYSDACGISTATLDIDTFTCVDLGDNTVLVTVTDPSGNTATCSAIVTVEDTMIPVVACMDITLELGPDGTATITPDDVATFSDNCEIVATAVDIEDFNCDDIGTPVNVTVFAVDGSSNEASCTAVVTVIDALAPVVTCPADQTVDPGAGSQLYEVPDYFADGLASAVDNCTDPVSIFTQNPAPGTLIGDGTYTVTLTATDAFGNEGECSFELTVESILGMNENSLDTTGLKMFPNPATNHVILSNPNNISLKGASIYDITGRLIRTLDVSQTSTALRIDISDLSSATYFFLIDTEAGKVSHQIIKN